jgi:hypothetical protein
MIYRLTTHWRRDENCLGLVIFPIRNANLLQIEHQFTHTPLNAFFQILFCSLQNHSRYLQTLLFLMGTFRFEDMARMAKNERIHAAASD